MTHRRRRYWLGLAAAITVLCGVPGVTQADSAYNSGVYTDCPYSGGCFVATPTPSAGSPAPTGGGTPTPTPPLVSEPAETAPPTVGQLPSGLEYSINLHDGQVIPPDTYTVIITPLNGQGQTFTKVEIYLDGVLQATPTPSATGTVYWPWDARRHPASRITIKITDSTGRATTREFNVTIGSRAVVPSSSDGLAGLRQALHRIPPLVVYSFPWLLFILLAIAIAIMVWQVRREVAESERLRALLARERLLAAEKTTFVSVASHYLRTPLTLIAGGQNLAAIDPATAGFASAIRQSIESLKRDVDALLTEIINHTEAAQVTDPRLEKPLARVWLRPAFIAPLVVLGGLVVAFNTLMSVVGNFSLPVINVLLQAAAFVVLAVSLYVVLRSLQLRRRERIEAQRLAEQRQAVDDSRNQLIHEAVQKLAGSVTAITQVIAAKPAGTAANAIRNGLGRFQDMLRVFAISEQVKTLGATTAPAVVDLATLVNGAVASNANQAQAKQLKMVIPSDHANIPSRNPELLQQAMGSIVSNAVGYSPVGGRVTLETAGGLQADSFTVRDEGPGLPPAQIQELFQPFFRAEGALNFAHEGMGFSLYLDKLIMHYLGGDIAVAANTPKGLVVTLSFPA